MLNKLNFMPTNFENLEIPKTIYEHKKLPKPGFYRFPNATKLSYFDPNILIKYINSFLSEIEGIRGQYNEKKFMWELEWGTNSIEYTLNMGNNDLYNIIKIKKWAACLATQKALQKFPHNIVHNEDIDYEFGFDSNKWCKITIMLSYIKEDNIILIEYNCLAGNTYSYYNIIDKVKKEINNEKNLNWFKRFQYLSFVEGIGENYDPKNHIMRYVCDYMIMRELSTLM